ncbi:MAG: LytTR family transcriptional regulator DNA-binding domain-containing protein [Clostridiales bacterium]|nr:LytTR family transcriptional regulator DNA-binding domain-containing protein [Clostridiales bacterium]
MMKRILILEDNVDSRAYMERLIREVCQERDRIYACENVQEAYLYAANGNIDLFVIDIMTKTGATNDVSGLTFIEHMRERECYLFTPVIFVTALQDLNRYTIDRLRCYMFFEKPFDTQDFKGTVAEALLFPGKKPDRKYYSFKQDGIIIQIACSEFVYAEVIRHHTFLHKSDGEVERISYMSLHRLLEEIGNDDVFQCSRHMIVNRAYINNADMVNRIINLKNDLGSVEIGVTYKNEVRQILGVIE